MQQDDVTPSTAQAGEHPWQAAMLDLVMSTLKPVRQKLVPLARGRVLEVGVGTGLNFPFYEQVDTLCGIEPDPHMIKRARSRAREIGLDIALTQAGAEALPYADASFDTVLVTWVLCTIPDPEAALREVVRVLVPGGRMLFAEHTLSRYPVARRFQGWVTPAWKKLSGNCHLNRDSIAMIRRVGFRDIEVKQCGRDTWTLLPMYRGTAVRPA